MGTIFLHIGMPKTGTSALQKFLAANRRLLEKKGFVFPDFGYVYPDIGKNRNGYFVSRITDMSFRETYKKEWDDSLMQLGMLAEGNKQIILSDESIWSVQRRPDFWESIRELFLSLGLDVHLIVYLRRQDEIIESYWNQRIKGHTHLTLTFDEFMEHEFHHMPVRYKKLLGQIEQKLCPAELTVHAYERCQLLDGNIINDFCNIIGFLPDEPCQYPKNAVNPSFDLDSLDVKRLINQNRFHSEINAMFCEAIANTRHEDGQIHIEKSPFSYEERVSFMSLFQEGNKYVAEKYLHHHDGRLFYEPLKKTEKWEPDALSQYRAAVRILSGADILLCRKVEELEKRVAELEQGNTFSRFCRKLKSKRRQSGREA